MRINSFTKSLFSSWLVVAMFLSNSSLLLAQPIVTQLGSDVEYELDTQFRGDRWNDLLFAKALKKIKKIPKNFTQDIKKTKESMKNIFKDGVKIGNVLIVKGAPDTVKILKERGKDVGIHYKNSIKLLPEHFQDAKGRIADGLDDVAKHTAENAQHTAEFASKQFEKFREDQKVAKQYMQQIFDWTKEKNSQNWKDAVKNVDEDVKQVGEFTKRVWVLAATTLVKLFVNGVELGREDITDLVEDVEYMAKWTAKQVPEGFKDTKAWTKFMAEKTKEWTKIGYENMVQDVEYSIKESKKSISKSVKRSKPRLKKASLFFKRVQQNIIKVSDKTAMAIADNTFEVVPEQLEKDKERTIKMAKKLWKRGWEKGVKEGLEDAGDQYFAGDYEGLLLGSYYTLASAVQGVSFILVMEPLVFSGNVALGVTKTAALISAGAVGIAGLTTASTGAHLLNIGSKLSYTTGVLAFNGLDIAATTTLNGLRVGGTFLLDGTILASAAGVGSLGTAGAAGAGFLRTVGGVGAGAVGTAGVAAWDASKLMLRPVWQATKGVGTLALGTGATAFGLGRGAVKTAYHTTWGTMKMVGISTAGVAGELFIPAVDFAVTAGRGSMVATTAVYDNILKTPAMASFDMVKALALGSWEMVKDPVKGSYHLVAGTTGFSYRVVGLTAAEATAGAAGALYAVGHVPVTFTVQGSQLVVAGTAKVISGIFAPLNFHAQNLWKEERLPQLQEILKKQPEEIREVIGEDVAYIRVRFSGVGRGKVNFFTTKKRGKTFKFSRKVDKDSCRITYVCAKSSITIDPELSDRHCSEAKK